MMAVEEKPVLTLVKKAPPTEQEMLAVEIFRRIRTGQVPAGTEIDQITNNRMRQIAHALADTARTMGGNEDDFWKMYDAQTFDCPRLDDFRSLLVISPETKPEKIRRYPLNPLSHLKNRTKPTWGVEGIVHDRGTSLFAGPGGSGKSALVLDMYLSRVCGLPFLGRNVKPAFLIWVAAESLDQLYPRAQAFLQCNKISVDDPLNFLYLEKRVPLNDPDETRLFLEEAQEQLSELNVSSDTHSVVVVFDTYSKCTPGTDENNTKEVKFIVEMIDFVEQGLKAHVSIICHTNDDNKVKGNKALRDGVDTVWLVSKNSDRICLVNDKMRGTLEQPPIYASMRSILLLDDDPDDTAPVIFDVDEKVGAKKLPPQSEIQMLTILQNNGTMKVTAWQEESEKLHKIKRRSFYTHKGMLVTQKLVTALPENAPRGAQIDCTITKQGIELLQSSAD